MPYVVRPFIIVINHCLEFGYFLGSVKLLFKEGNQNVLRNYQCSVLPAVLKIVEDYIK